MQGCQLGPGYTGVSLVLHRGQPSLRRHSKPASGPGLASASPPSAAPKSVGALCTPRSCKLLIEPRRQQETHGCTREELKMQVLSRVTSIPWQTPTFPPFPKHTQPCLLLHMPLRLRSQPRPIPRDVLSSPAPINIQHFPRPLSPSSPNTSCPYQPSFTGCFNISRSADFIFPPSNIEMVFIKFAL